MADVIAEIRATLNAHDALTRNPFDGYGYGKPISSDFVEYTRKLLSVVEKAQALAECDPFLEQPDNVHFYVCCFCHQPQHTDDCPVKALQDALATLANEGG